MGSLLRIIIAYNASHLVLPKEAAELYAVTGVSNAGVPSRAISADASGAALRFMLGDRGLSITDAAPRRPVLPASTLRIIRYRAFSHACAFRPKPGAYHNPGATDGGRGWRPRSPTCVSDSRAPAATLVHRRGGDQSVFCSGKPTPCRLAPDCDALLSWHRCASDQLTDRAAAPSDGYDQRFPRACRPVPRRRGFLPCGPSRIPSETARTNRKLQAPVSRLLGALRHKYR
jgi:hypothetical protein